MVGSLRSTLETLKGSNSSSSSGEIERLYEQTIVMIFLDFAARFGLDPRHCGCSGRSRCTNPPILANKHSLVHRHCKSAQLRAFLPILTVWIPQNLLGVTGPLSPPLSSGPSSTWSASSNLYSASPSHPRQPLIVFPLLIVLQLLSLRSPPPSAPPFSCQSIANNHAAFHKSSTRRHRQAS